jgi:hypothetical protein
VRLAGVALALLVCAWFALGLRQTTATNAARSRLSVLSAPTPAAARATGRLLDRAAWLNPDRGVAILRADLALAQGRAAAGRGELLHVVRSEPDNVTAWGTIAVAFARTDPPLATRARRELRRLSPPVPAP